MADLPNELPTHKPGYGESHITAEKLKAPYLGHTKIEKYCRKEEPNELYFPEYGCGHHKPHHKRVHEVAPPLPPIKPPPPVIPPVIPPVTPPGMCGRTECPPQSGFVTSVVNSIQSVFTHPQSPVTETHTPSKPPGKQHGTEGKHGQSTTTGMHGESTTTGTHGESTSTSTSGNVGGRTEGTSPNSPATKGVAKGVASVGEGMGVGPHGMGVGPHGMGVGPHGGEGGPGNAGMGHGHGK